MRIRARYIHHVEVATDILVGFAINYGLIFVVYNWMLGHDISYSDNFLGGLVFMAVAYARKYTIRRWFSNWIGRIYAEQKAQEDAEQLQEQTGKS